MIPTVTVVVRPYDPGWPELARAAGTETLAALGTAVS
jgi:hypothetical protein